MSRREKQAPQFAQNPWQNFIGTQKAGRLSAGAALPSPVPPVPLPAALPHIKHPAAPFEKAPGILPQRGVFFPQELAGRHHILGRRHNLTDRGCIGLSMRFHGGSSPFHPPASAARSQGPIQPAAHAFGSPVQAGSSGLPLPYLSYNYHKSRLSVKPETRAGSRPPLCRQGAGTGPSGQICQKLPSGCLPGPGRAPRKTQRRAG